MTAHAIETPASPPWALDAAGERARMLVAPAALAALLFALAVAVRLLGVDLFVTPDEDNWMRRAGNFTRAMQSGRFEATFQSGHPGVTTMWVASLGMGPAGERLAGLTSDDPSTIVTRHPDWAWLFSRARHAMIVVNAALIAIIGALAWRLLGPGAALLGGMLMALDPFMVAHGQVVHVDALATGLITVAVLAGGIYWLGSGGWGYLALCAVACGLGILTKAPSLFLVAFVPAVAVAGAVADPRAWPPRRLALSLILCGLGGLLTIFVAWPALWVAPIETVQRVVEYQILQGATPHGPGNYFLGRPVADPGYLFYPIAVAFRLAPAVVAGLVALVAVLPPPSLRHRTGLLVVFVLAFLVFVTLASKKLDRYALPAFPSLALIAGVGLWSALKAVEARISPRGSSAARRAFGGLVGVAGLGQALALLSVAPYPLAFYNPLLGGGAAAQRVLLVGWGEGLDQVAGYLNARPDAATANVAVYFTLTWNFQGMIAGTVHRFTDPVPTDYVVDYVNVSQRGQSPVEVIGRVPDFVVRINGIEYARVYRFDPPRMLRPTLPPLE